VAQAGLNAPQRPSKDDAIVRAVQARARGTSRFSHDCRPRQDQVLDDDDVQGWILNWVFHNVCSSRFAKERLVSRGNN
jgi:hypothetical protein